MFRPITGHRQVSY